MRQEYNHGRLGSQHVKGIGLRVLEVLIRISGSEAEETHDNPIIIADNLTEIRNEYIHIKVYTVTVIESSSAFVLFLARVRVINMKYLMPLLLCFPYSLPCAVSSYTCPTQRLLPEYGFQMCLNFEKLTSRQTSHYLCSVWQNTVDIWILLLYQTVDGSAVK
jgi:hypothetical protein